MNQNENNCNCNSNCSNSCNSNCSNSCNSNCSNSCNNNCNNINNDSSVSPSTGVFETCCTGQTGCSWDGNINSLVLEPIYVQKIYDTVLLNLQGISYANKLSFSPKLPVGSIIVGVDYINITKFFNPNNYDCNDNFEIKAETTLQGAQFIKEGGNYVHVVGPDGEYSEKIIYVDTSYCDTKSGGTKGTPIFGSQDVTIKGLVRVDMMVRYLEPDCCGNSTNKQLLTGYFKICSPHNGQDLVLTNFFELCVPSVFNGAFLPRFTELCNAALTGKLMTNNISRDVFITENGTVEANIIIAICLTCEKKIVMPAQLCVLSTGFTQISPDSGNICTEFPSLFPSGIDSQVSSGGGNCCKPHCNCNCNCD